MPSREGRPSPAAGLLTLASIGWIVGVALYTPRGAVLVAAFLLTVAGILQLETGGRR